MKISLLHRVLDLIAPRSCCICDSRLAPEEDMICVRCNLHLPRTDHLANPYENEMAKTFWGRVRHIEKAVAMIYHQGGSQASYPIYNLKYRHREEMGVTLGKMMAREMAEVGFFDDIDLLVAVPLSDERRRERGYNQSEIIAKGMVEVCRKPLVSGVLARQKYHGSLTTKGRWERNDSVEKAFVRLDDDKIRSRHVLLVDDVVTTGATICACAKLLEAVEGVKISVASVGFVDPRR